MTNLSNKQFQTIKSKQDLPEIPFNEGLYVPNEQEQKPLNETKDKEEKVEFLNG